MFPRAGSILATRGEFSILLAGLGASAGLNQQLGALTAAYVLFLSVLGPVMAQMIKPLSFVYKKVLHHKVPVDSGRRHS